MPTLKILLLVIFGIITLMIITAVIHLIAPYVAALTVIGVAIYLCIKANPPDKGNSA